MNVDLQAARNWGDAIFLAAKDANEVPRLLEEAAALLAALEQVPRFVAFLEAPNVPHDDKVALAEKVLGGQFSRLLRNAVLLMLRRNRIDLLRTALDEFRARAERDQDIWRGTVQTAKELDADQRKRVQESLERRTGKKLVLDWKIDPTTLGGVVFKSGDLLIDNSLRMRLAALGEQLMAARV